MKSISFPRNTVYLNKIISKKCKSCPFGGSVTFCLKPDKSLLIKCACPQITSGIDVTDIHIYTRRYLYTVHDRCGIKKKMLCIVSDPPGAIEYLVKHLELVFWSWVNAMWYIESVIGFCSAVLFRKSF